MNIPLDEDDLQQMGLGTGLLGGDGSAAPASGLGAALSQLTLVAPQVPSFPPPLDPDIPGGAALFSRALAGLGMPQSTDAPAPDQPAGNTASDPAGTPDAMTTPAAGAAVTPPASKFDVDKAAAYLDAHAAPAYDPNAKHYCARAVRLAIAAGGRDVANTDDAQDYGPKLVQAGYTQLDADARKTYTPQKGDVIIYPAWQKHTSGHMEMYDGKHWVSDFMQKGPVPYGDGTLPHEIYRP